MLPSIPTSRAPNMKGFVTLSLFLAGSMQLVSSQDASGNNTTPTFDWDSIKPSANLTWVDCYKTPLQCTRLTVPLNYSDPSAGTAALALIRYPSPHANTSSYKGPILYNPGGPGGSAVDDLVGGVNLQTKVGEEFDFVGFDPRGVRFSAPTIQLFPSTNESAAFAAGATDLLSLAPSTWDTLPDRMKQIDEIGTQAVQIMGDVLKYYTTDNVARDMLTIAEAHGREKVSYYGISYGTILGATFATLFPDKIERFVIDGVANAEEYYDGNNWTSSVLDADKTLRVFFSNCIAAGSSNCTFYSPTVQELEDRFTTILQKLDSDPWIIDPSTNTTLSVSAVESLVQDSLYFPTKYAGLADQLKAVEDRNLTGLGGASAGASVGSAGAISPSLKRRTSSSLTSRADNSTSSSGNNTSTTPSDSPPGTGLAEFGLTMNCMDGARVDGSDTADDLIEYAKGVQKLSKWFLTLASNKKVFCSGWKIKSDHFRGPIGAQTNSPIMIIGNTADPVTPLASAKDAQQKFPGSKLLTFDAPGHTSAFWPSDCVSKYLYNYFQNGTLPEDGAVCGMPGSLFPTNPSGVVSGQGLNGTGENGDGGSGGGGEGSATSLLERGTGVGVLMVVLAVGLGLQVV